jgi:asparagine synthetase B (glutamine-hydrolysing)
VTVGDAPAGMLAHLRSRLRSEIGERAVLSGRAFDEFVDAICRNWNSEHWTKLARAQPHSQTLAVMDAKVLIAKVREDIEFMWGDSPELQHLYATVGTEAVEVFARLWFQSLANRTWMRKACREARQP